MPLRIPRVPKPKSAIRSQYKEYLERVANKIKKPVNHKSISAIILIAAYPVLYALTKMRDGTVMNGCESNILDYIYMIMLCAGVSMYMYSSKSHKYCYLAMFNYLGYGLLYSVYVFLEWVEWPRTTSRIMDAFPELLLISTIIICIFYFLVLSLRSARTKE